MSFKVDALLSMEVLAQTSLSSIKVLEQTQWSIVHVKQTQES